LVAESPLLTLVCVIGLATEPGALRLCHVEDARSAGGGGLRGPSWWWCSSP